MFLTKSHVSRVKNRVGSIHFFLSFKFKFIDFEKFKFKFKLKFIDFEKLKFKFIDFEKTKCKFIDFEKTKLKLKFTKILRADSNLNSIHLTSH